MLHYLDGDAASPTGSEVIIAHVVNNIGKWGMGFSRSIWMRHPEVKLDYLQSRKPLGLVIWSTCKDNTLVAHMVAMRGVRSQENPKPIVYSMLEQCLTFVAARAIQSGRAVHMPRIGSGLAGGEWPTIEGIVQRSLVEFGVDVFVYTLPDKPEVIRPRVALTSPR